MSDVSEASLLDYFGSSGDGVRVRNADLLSAFRPFIGHSDAHLRAKYREEFKLAIDRIAVVKSENGEKYLVLKKKYRPMLPDRARTPAAVQWEASPAHLEQDEPDGAAEAPQAGTAPEQPPPPRRPDVPVQEPSLHSNGEDEPDKDSGSKSESEQEEEGSGSGGPAALDPIEKEWIYSAAGARLPDLSHLLRQDPSLANKKDFTSFTALHWAAKHGSEDMATLVANAGADVNTKSGYTPLHIAALHGHQHILDLLIRTYGAAETLRDYSGRLAVHYLNPKEPEVLEDDGELPFQITQSRERNRNRKLASLFHSKKKWVPPRIWRR
ncbi:ankyrin repeat domain-containing protein SOWAHA [Brachionichthys hirsutus]|uniref:ankyrin repeat domain-containing protein SOWAHA n=1 Tax=Brachionichthys hirsutus TaxID=412623 RepID=UPI003604F943